MKNNKRLALRTLLAFVVLFSLTMLSISPAFADETTTETTTEVVEETTTTTAPETEEIVIDPVETPDEETTTTTPENEEEISGDLATTSDLIAPAAATQVNVSLVADRDGSGNLVPLEGGEFTAYANSSLNTILGTCTTDANGECSIAFNNSSASCSLFIFVCLARTAYIQQTDSPAGYTALGPITSTTALLGGIFGIQATLNNVASVTWFGGSGAPQNTRTFQAVRDNNSWEDACGLDVALVIDRSWSMDVTDGDDIKTAAKSFVTALEGTESQVSVTSFGGTATSNLALTSVETSTDATVVNDAIDALVYPNVSATNIDAGLRSVASDGADVVILITDGNPTAYGTGPSFVTLLNPRDGVENAVASANLVKANGAKVVTVGIGADISAQNLAAFSGPAAGVDNFIGGYGALETLLADSASDGCVAVGGIVVQQPVDVAGVSVSGTLPTTGVNPWLLAQVSLALLLVGAVLAITTRSKNTTL